MAQAGNSSAACKCEKMNLNGCERPWWHKVQLRACLPISRSSILWTALKIILGPRIKISIIHLEWNKIDRRSSREENPMLQQGFSARAMAHGLHRKKIQHYLPAGLCNIIKYRVWIVLKDCLQNPWVLLPTFQSAAPACVWETGIWKRMETQKNTEKTAGTCGDP